MRNRKIGVLMGGFSSEQEISSNTGQAVLGALLDRGYDARGIYVDRNLDQTLRRREIEVAFIALHGRYGEDGCVQGMLELMGIPYTGSDVLSSALAMNKVKSKELFFLNRLPTPPYYAVRRDDLGAAHRRHRDFGFPAILKPACEGSPGCEGSLGGLHLLRNTGDLSFALAQAAKTNQDVLIERYIAGKEISVAVVEGRALGAIERDAGDRLYDYPSQSSESAPRYFVPPRVRPEEYRSILAQAEVAHRILGCSGATLVDLILARSGHSYILEVNAAPSLTPSSLLTKIAHAAGLQFADLVEAILCGARLAAFSGKESTSHSRLDPDIPSTSYTQAPALSRRH